MTCGIAANLCQQNAACRNHLNQPHKAFGADVAPTSAATSSSASAKADPHTLCAALAHAVLDFLTAAGLNSDETSLGDARAAADSSDKKQETVLTEDLILGGYMCILLGCTIIDNSINAAAIGQVLRDRIDTTPPATDSSADDEKQGASGCAAPLIRVICGFLNFQVSNLTPIAVCQLTNYLCQITVRSLPHPQQPRAHIHTRANANQTCRR